MRYEMKTSVESKEKREGKKKEDELNHNWQQYKKELDRKEKDKEKKKIKTIYAVQDGIHVIFYMCIYVCIFSKLIRGSF